MVSIGLERIFIIYVSIKFKHIIQKVIYYSFIIYCILFPILFLPIIYITKYIGACQWLTFLSWKANYQFNTLDSIMVTYSNCLLILYFIAPLIIIPVECGVLTLRLYNLMRKSEKLRNAWKKEPQINNSSVKYCKVYIIISLIIIICELPFSATIIDLNGNYHFNSVIIYNIISSRVNL